MVACDLELAKRCDAECSLKCFVSSLCRRYLCSDSAAVTSDVVIDR